jgi:hypothetical protein
VERSGRRPAMGVRWDATESAITIHGCSSLKDRSARHADEENAFRGGVVPKDDAIVATRRKDGTYQRGLNGYGWEEREWFLGW